MTPALTAVPVGGGIATWDVTLSNTGEHTCSLNGYPTLRARGCIATEAPCRVVDPISVQVEHGNTATRRDRGKHAVTLRPGASAVFTIQTSAMYGGAIAHMSQLLVTIAGSGAMRRIAVGIDLDGPSNAQPRIIETAIATA